MKIFFPSLFAQAPSFPELAPIRPAIEVIEEKGIDPSFYLLLFLIVFLLIGLGVYFRRKKRKKNKVEIISIAQSFDGWKSGRPSPEKGTLQQLRQYFRSALREQFPQVEEEASLEELQVIYQLPLESFSRMEELSDKLDHAAFSKEAPPEEEWKDLVSQVGKFIRKEKD